MKLYFKYMKVQFKTNLTYLSSTMMALIGQLLTNLSAFLGVFLLFEKFDMVGEYTISHILMTFGVVVLVFSIDEMMFRGFDEFEKLVGSGDFDTLLLRPRNIVLQICGHKVEFMKIGRVILGIVIVIIACCLSGINWNLLKVIALIEMILSGVIVFFGVYLLTSSVTLFTIQRAEFLNIFTDGGRELCYYPLDIFKKYVTKFFTFVLPFATFNYIPVRYMFDIQGSSDLVLLCPLGAIAFTFIAYIIFNICVKFYKSAG